MRTTNWAKTVKMKAADEEIEPLLPFSVVVFLLSSLAVLCWCAGFGFDVLGVDVECLWWLQYM